MPVALWTTNKGDVLSNNLGNDTAISFGSGSADCLGNGNITRQVSGAGISPGATAADNVLAVFSLPASSFDVAGRGINILAMGSFATNANTKTVKIIFNATTAVVGSTVTGGTTIATTTASTGSNVAFMLESNVFKYGAAASNTQLGLNAVSQVGSTVNPPSVPAAITATESGAILIAVTGNSATTASDILLNLFVINAMN